MYRYKNNISVFTICYTSHISIYTHPFVNGAFIYSTYIYRQLWSCCTAGFLLAFFFSGCLESSADPKTFPRPVLEPSSCIILQSQGQHLPTRELRRPGPPPTDGGPTYFFSFCLLKWEKLWGGRPRPPT